MSTSDGNIILSLTILFAGALIGIISSIITSSLEKRKNISTKLFEEYLKIREELCEKLSEISSLREDIFLDEKFIKEMKKYFHKAYYKYYDFLPPEILKEILCLYSCLSDKNNNIYKIENNRILPIEKESDLDEFIERISLTDNFRYYALVPLKYGNADVRKSTSIQYQARSVLIAINRYFTINNLSSWSKHLRKHSKKG